MSDKSTLDKIQRENRRARKFLDKHILKEAFDLLPLKQREILRHRFGNNLAIHEIASLLNLKSQEVEWYLISSLKTLRDFCLRDPAFSWNWPPHSTV